MSDHEATIDPLDAGCADPPFEQLRAQVARRAADGSLPGGTRLPTVRALAARLGVATNTVARAYRELESDGVVVTEGRRGTFVRSGTTAGSADARTAAQEYAGTCRRLGLTRAEAVRLLEGHWAD